jgi:TPR repeat protein
MRFTLSKFARFVIRDMRERAIILAVTGLFAVGFQFGAVAGPAKRQAAPPVDPLSAFDIAPLAPPAPKPAKIPQTDPFADYPTTQPSVGPVDDAQAAYSRGDYETALRIWRSQGDNGNADAQLRLGNYFWNGNAVEPNYPEAIGWWRKAADKGNPEAQTDLGTMYLDGAGVPQDFEMAALWLRKAADQGWDVAQERLGALYEAGYGVPKDSVQAHMWLNLAASRVRDSYLRGAYAKARNDLAFKMTTDQVTQAQRLARDWVPKIESLSAGQSNPPRD